MTQSDLQTSRFDPYKNFKFRLKWDGRYVAGISKVGALVDAANRHPITLERGVTHDSAFEKWASAAAAGAETLRKDITIELCDEAGHVTRAYDIFRCWVSEFAGLPDLDANANAFAIGHMKLEHEGFERAEPSRVLPELAQKIDPAAAWDDLVLPKAQLRALHEIASQLRHRAKGFAEWGFSKDSRAPGLSALFAGPSGTGKTLAAEVLANYLKLDLYRIDLSLVVGKYIGGTEKNLRRVFEAGDKGGAILLFDEADALFGKRTDVKDSHDRFANLEASYLLTRIEKYRGLTILTINQKQALDPVFLRRFRFVVNFPEIGDWA